MNQQGNSTGGGGGGAGGGSSQPNNPTHFAARVPEGIARGVYSSAHVVIDNPKEVVVDFLMGITRPFSVVARVVMTPQTLAEFIPALEQNLDNYIQQYGPPPALPTPVNEHKPTLEEIYEHFKLSDDMLSGAYANAVLIGHSASEFVFDFFTNFHPTPAVGSRVYVPAPVAARFLNTLKSTHQRYQQRSGNDQKPNL